MAAAVSVVVPFRSDGADRDRAWAWLEPKWQATGCEVAVGAMDGDEWCKAHAVSRGARKATGAVLVVADADVWCEGTSVAIQAVQDGAPWAIPHLDVRRLSPSATDAVIAGGPFDRRYLAEHEYRGHPGGGIVVLRRDTYDRVPLDPRFVGWGREDDAWSLALTTLVGRPWRGRDPLWHLWHPPQERQTRKVGSDANEALFCRYQSARHRPEAMREIIEEIV